MIVFADVNYVEGTLVMIAKSLIIFLFVLQVVPLILLLERKLLGRFQSRIGPNRVGPYGLMQPLADVLKLLSKENSVPNTAVPWMMALAPVISIFTAFGALAFYALMLRGWASGSKYSFLGAMRSAAQLISYEIALGLSLLGVVIQAQSMSLVSIVQAQHNLWYVVPQFIGFCIFMVAGFAETNRPPFDLAEGDSEIVGGFNTEFGGMRFGSFFMAEYINMIVIAGIATATFLGGWHGPGPAALNPLWVILKMLFFIVLFIWVRATLPRLRYDQLMSFGWKVLLPLATLNVLVTAILVAT